MEGRKETSVSIVPRNTEGQKEAPSSIVPRNTRGQNVTKVSENIPAIEHAVIGPEKTQASKDVAKPTSQKYRSNSIDTNAEFLATTKIAKMALHPVQALEMGAFISRYASFFNLASPC